jgi:hypothetical protein
VKGARSAEAVSRRLEADRRAYSLGLVAARLVAGSLMRPRIVSCDDVAAAIEVVAWAAARELAPGAVLA